jgi:alpha-beta hydrolase superfamily lysophospholipase
MPDIIPSTIPGILMSGNSGWERSTRILGGTDRRITGMPRPNPPQPDILGDSYEMIRLDFPDDYEGQVVATVVRYKEQPHGRHAVLYIHGYNDYFFQRHVAEFYASRGISFYALDLRRYGRSLLPHQTPYFCHSLREYYPDIKSAIQVIKDDSHESVLINAHSTGGLIASLWADEGNGHDLVAGLILNSPYLSSGIPASAVALVRPFLGSMARCSPKIAFPLRMSPRYVRSLHRSFSGEWDFESKWKCTDGTRLRLAWLASILAGQQRVNDGLNISMPIVVLCSAASASFRATPSQLRVADAVLNVRDIARLSVNLGRNVTCIRICGAVHDVFLSDLPTREKAFECLSQWLATTYVDQRLPASIRGVRRVSRP